MTKEEALAAVRDAFAGVERPEMFIRGTCLCDECVEHNEVMAAHTPDNIRMEELGHPAWDPICFASDQAFAYYLPALMRLALEEEYLDQFLFHLNVPGRVDFLTRRQVRALHEALWVLAEVQEERLTDWGEWYRLEEAIGRLEYADLAFES